MKSGFVLAVSIAVAICFQSDIRAALVITTQVNITNNAVDLTNAVVTVDIFGSSSGPGVQSINTYGLNVTIVGIAPQLPTTATYGSGDWGAFVNKTSLPVSAVNTILFQGYQGIAIAPSNINISTTPSLIGRYAFDVVKTASSQAFTVTSTLGTARGQTGVNSVTNLPTPGFFNQDGNGDYAAIALAPSSILSGSGVISGNIVAVPEPTSLALVGVVGLGYLVRRRRLA